MRKHIFTIFLFFITSLAICAQSKCTIKIVFVGEVQKDKTKDYVRVDLLFPSSECLLGEQPFQSYYGFHSINLEGEIDSFEFETLTHESDIFCEDSQIVFNEFFKIDDSLPFSYMTHFWKGGKDKLIGIGSDGYIRKDIPMELIKITFPEKDKIVVQVPPIKL